MNCTKSDGPILTFCTSYEVFLRNDVLFGNIVDNAVHLGSRIEDNTVEVGVNRRFQAMLQMMVQSTESPSGQPNLGIDKVFMTRAVTAPGPHT